MKYFVLKDIVNCPAGNVIQTLASKSCRDLWRKNIDGDYVHAVLRCDIQDSIDQGFIERISKKGKQGVKK